MNGTHAVMLGVGLGLAGLVAGGAAMAAHMKHEMPASAKVTLAAAEVVVPMDSFGGRPVVALMLDGKGPHRFVLDTGSGGSVLSQSLADSLGLESKGQARVGAPGGATNAGTLVRIGRVEMGGVTLTDLSLVATDLSRVFHQPDHPVGVLSALAFAGHLVTFDYPHQRIVVRPGELPAANGTDTFEYKAAQHSPTLEIVVAGVPVQAHLDSGSGRGLMLPAGLADKLPLAGPLVEKGKARTVDGEWPLREALSRDNGLVLIGATSRFVEDAIAYESPLYDFFRVHELGQVTEEEARRVVVHLAKLRGHPRVEKLIESL